MFFSGRACVFSPTSVYELYHVYRAQTKIGWAAWAHENFFMACKFLESSVQLASSQCLKLMVAQSPLVTKNWVGPVKFDPGQVKTMIGYMAVNLLGGGILANRDSMVCGVVNNTSFHFHEFPDQSLTHLPLVPHICASELGQHWFR